jgi:hypothetical protein
MAKISRTPFNGSRWITSYVSSDTTITKKLTGRCFFVTASSTTNLNVNFLDSGCYFKIIAREDTTGNINISFPTMEGVLIADDTSSVAITNAGESDQTTLTIPSGASAGSYVDLICDGQKWYVTGMAHGVHFTQS